jgi:dTDP-4-amino-4,6-dideoxygalactose transaminase
MPGRKHALGEPALGSEIPFVDLSAQYESIRSEVEPRIVELLKSGEYTGGHAVKEFENDFAIFTGVNYAMGVANGTDALRLAMEAVGVTHGSEVVTVSHTFVATAEAAIELGARVRFVDVEETTGLIDAEKLREAVTDQTVAIVPVHLYGRPVDMDAVMEVAGEHGCAVIEDAAQAHGATYKGKTVGSIGDLGCFSFYPTKNLGAAGDGGAITTDSAELAERVRMLANHGGLDKYVHSIVGWNSRLDAIQATILSVKLRHLSEWNARRRAIAAQYNEMLGNIEDIILPAADGEIESVFHLYATRVRNREIVRAKLAELEIWTGVHYPIPIHLQDAYRHINGNTPLPNTEKWAATELSLPMFAELSDSEVAHVCEVLYSLLTSNHKMVG